MAVTQLSIINRARVEAGEEVVTDLTPVDAMMRAAIASYEDIVQDELENGEWAFGIRKQIPTLTATDTDSSLPYQYALDPETIGVVSVRYLDQPLEGWLFRINGRAVWTAYNSGITFLVKNRPGEGLWPRRFSELVVLGLKAVFLDATERHAEASDVRVFAHRKRIMAKHSESAQRHNRPMGQGSIINRRRGGGHEMITNLPDCGGGAVSNGSGNVLYPNDNDVFVNTDYTVEPGVGYVGADCTAGGGVTLTITYTASDDTLNKKCTFQKVDSTGLPSDLGTIVLADGVGNSVEINGSDTQQYRRVGGFLRGPY